MRLSPSVGLGRSVSEVTWCCRPRAGETVLSYRSCPLPFAPFCCWFLFCFEDWTLHYIDSFHAVTATELAKLLERENEQTLLGRVHAKSCSGNSKTGQSPGGPLPCQLTAWIPGLCRKEADTLRGMEPCFTLSGEG